MNMLNNKSFAKTALSMASFFIMATAFLFAGCNLGTDPEADGARFNRQFYYYYAQDCRYDNISTYDCGPIVSISPSMKVSLRIDSDGLANLNIDGDRYYYLAREYSEGYDRDYGSYFRFYQDEDELTIYKDGSVLGYWDTMDGTVTFYYYDYWY